MEKVKHLSYIKETVFVINLYSHAIIPFWKNKNGYSPFRGKAPLRVIRRISKVAFLLFLTPAGGSNPAGQSPNLP